MAKLRFEDVKKEVEDYGWELLSDDYVNLESELRVKCAEGHECSLSLKQLRRNKECPVCKENPFKKIQNVAAKPKKDKKCRILALDQATNVSGWSVFDGTSIQGYGIFEIPKYYETEERILKFVEWLLEMIGKWQPDLIVIEDIQYQTSVNGVGYGGVSNIMIFKTLAWLQGAIIATCKMHGIEYRIVSSNTWRSFCEVKGRYRTDKKKSAQLRVKELIDISVTQDEADAICIGKYAAERLIKTVNQEMIIWN